MIIEQGSLNVSISSAFQEILRAQRTLCSLNATSASTTTSAITFPPAATAATVATALSMSRRYDEGEDEYEVRRRRNVEIIQGQGQGQGPWSVGGPNSNQRVLTNQNEEEDQMADSEQRQSPHATICGKHPAIRIYHRRGKGKGRDQGGSTTGSSSHNGILSMLHLCMTAFPPFLFKFDSHSSSFNAIATP